MAYNFWGLNKTVITVSAFVIETKSSINEFGFLGFSSHVSTSLLQRGVKQKHWAWKPNRGHTDKPKYIIMNYRRWFGIVAIWFIFKAVDRGLKDGLLTANNTEL